MYIVYVYEVCSLHGYVYKVYSLGMWLPLIGLETTWVCVQSVFTGYVVTSYWVRDTLVQFELNFPYEDRDVLQTQP